MTRLFDKVEILNGGWVPELNDIIYVDDGNASRVIVIYSLIFDSGSVPIAFDAHLVEVTIRDHRERVDDGRDAVYDVGLPDEWMEPVDTEVYVIRNDSGNEK